ncbi:cobalamin biosynthesis protein [Tepidimonas taiwanensis]|uniref:CobD/Cbib protein n=1 Tax=Tepidimonas taiwanensis TaxID=307486 RepID=A0A554XD45_9BURK|nr:cobalamin biosynthesis protein [Tepidimonas taiwanensis]MCX7692219.1 cobalamin biosynthesis protein [Tepidimonas taiwanensis]MDM7462149.1 cobalamin biosynthesis protein [Tepidimonas taiwanensis]TSE33757.1 CobD/Cbib protein [Tepidimonas taiwanensis]UBQ06696.1 cobalamin biosynthesis protein [Tepidimonas taiwanensis]
MTFFAVLLALVLDQARRPGADAVWHGPMGAWAAWVQHQFDAGHPRQGWLVWGLAVGVPVLAVTAVYLALAAVSGLLAFAWTVAVLYATLGFRQFSHHFTAIRAALESGDEARARALFAEWSGAPAVDWPREELLRRVIAQAVLCAHRHVLGVLGWFVVLAALGLGPAGAVLYRAASWLAQQWPLDAPRPAVVSESVARATARAWCGIDALPARLTVLGFAVVGHFEEALERWRAHATAWWEPSDALLLAVAGGAMQMRLWPRAPADEGDRAEGAAPQLAHLASTVGLVWRSVVLWLLVLALALLARIF